MIYKTSTLRYFRQITTIACFFVLVHQDNQAQALPIQPNKDLPKIGVNARIVSLSPAATEALFYIGAGEQLVGRTSACNYPESVKQVPQIGSMFPPNPENILRLKPKLVLMTRGFSSL
ncbi:MAG: hypothetical protein ACPGQS_03805, partial [Bradymonadia bacterium]